MKGRVATALRLWFWRAASHWVPDPLHWKWRLGSRYLRAVNDWLVVRGKAGSR